MASPQGHSLGAVLAQVIAGVIVLLTLALVIAGIFLIVFDFPNLIAGALGLLLLALAYVLRPRLEMRPDGLPRDAFPALAELLDDLSHRLDAPKITSIELTSDWNAAIWQRRNIVHLQIGLPLLVAAPPAVRLAILAHEIAHLVNNDPRRRALPMAARRSLAAWLDMLGYGENRPVFDDFSGLTELLRQIAGSLLRALQVLMDRASFFDAQRSEYLADALAARMAGPDAMRDALYLTASGFALDRALQRFVPDGAQRGAETLDHLCDMAQLSDADIEARNQRLERELLQTDVAHPPTAYRLGFLETLGHVLPALTLTPAAHTQLEAEWAPYRDKIGREVLARRSIHKL